jgi:hypothetical protein
MIAESGIEEAITEFIRLSRALRPSEDTTLSAAVSLAAIIKFSISISDAARVRLLPAHLKRREFIGGLTVTLLAAGCQRPGTLTNAT